MSDKGVDQKATTTPTRHWVLWTLVAIFVIGSIAAMMMADYRYAPGSNGSTSEPKDAADK